MNVDTLNAIGDVILHPATLIIAAPVLAVGVILGAIEWHRLGQDDDAFTIDDYATRPVTGRATVPAPRTAGDDTETTDLRHHLPVAPPGTDGGGSPLYYALEAAQWLRELARREVTR